MADASMEMRDDERLIGRHWVNYEPGRWAGWAVVSNQRIRFTARMNTTQYKTSLATGRTASGRGTGWTVEIPREQIREVRYSKGIIRSRCEIVLGRRRDPRFPSRHVRGLQHQEVHGVFARHVHG